MKTWVTDDFRELTAASAALIVLVAWSAKSPTVEFIDVLDDFILALTLLVVWRYTRITGQLQKTTDAQLRLSIDNARVANRPYVVLEREDLPDGGYYYTLKNLGRAVSVNWWKSVNASSCD